MPAHSRPASPSLLHAERSMMPASCQRSSCGASSAVRKRRDCSSSRTRSSLIQAGRGRLRASIVCGLIAIWVLMVDETPRELGRDELVETPAWQMSDRIEPRDLAVDAVLQLRARDLGIIEAARGHADVRSFDEAVGQRRAAGRAEMALGEARAAEHRRLSAGPPQVLF